MSNEYKDWLWDRFSDILLENGALDRITHTEVKNWLEWSAIVEGFKDGIPLKYEVWFDNSNEDEDKWNYKLII